MKKAGSQISTEEINKLKYQVTEARSEVTLLSTEVKMMESQLEGLDNMKRQLAKLALAPTDADFINIRNRLDMCEK